MLSLLRKPLLYLSALVGVDQFTKYLVSTRFYLGESVAVTPFFNLTFVTNTGIAFSMFQGANTIFAVFSVLVLIGFSLWYLKNRKLFDAVVKAAILFIAAGAVGNLIDRLSHGFVIDFIDIGIGGFRWPSFNVADSCITLGGAVLFYRLFFPLKDTSREPAGEVKE